MKRLVGYFTLTDFCDNKSTLRVYRRDDGQITYDLTSTYCAEHLSNLGPCTDRLPMLCESSTTSDAWIMDTVADVIEQYSYRDIESRIDNESFEEPQRFDGFTRSERRELRFAVNARIGAIEKSSPDSASLDTLRRLWNEL